MERIIVRAELRLGQWANEGAWHLQLNDAIEWSYAQQQTVEVLETGIVKDKLRCLIVLLIRNVVIK